jgi:hypothetical protein
MTDVVFEWDEAKAADNYAKHGVSFEFARGAFKDPFGVERADDREDYGEDRVVLIGGVEGSLLTVVFTERNSRIRTISARRSTKREKDDYFIENS